MDNTIINLKTKLTELKKLIEKTEKLSKQHGQPAVQKVKALNKVQKNISLQFLKWYQEVGKLVVEHELHYNEELLTFTKQVKKIELEEFGHIGGYIDYMRDCFDELEKTIELFEHRDSIGLARDFKTIEGNTSLTKLDYNEIIDALYRYGIQISRTMKTYSGLNEEDIRFTILNGLNVMYGGRGTGETFNGTGKTDIYIPLKDINIFLAECKVLHNNQQVTKGLQQILFDYLTPHDGKVALVIFNKAYDASEAFDKVQEQTDKFLTSKSITYSKYPDEVKQYKHTLRYNFVHPKDSSIDIILTVMVINII
ncbi:hypothetical protein FKQ51_24520 [Bacillus toyonensis]|uniref:hypothetical protein n=1 Tax=Bacillus toyonensis TaxID=155322 RepID=UPI0027055CC2|nr:hypothetical protein [Bacillus toyonensis]MDO8160422.1 hypothetical protein [Bacillus toyonensis]